MGGEEDKRNFGKRRKSKRIIRSAIRIEPMIERIISGGQTGADRAALDVAIKLGISYGGWIPKGRITEEGPLPEEYQMQEMPTESYAARTEQNVIDSDGTLIICRGKSTGGSDYTREMTLKHKKQLLHVDLNQTTSFDAASLIVSWIKLYNIKILNVAGPRASKDPNLYVDVFRILEMTLKIYRIEDISPAQKAELDKIKQSAKPPKTVDEAVKRLISDMSLKDKHTIANIDEVDLINLNFSLGLSIRNRFLYPRNEQLLESCRFVSKDKYLHWDQAASVIIRELWKQLKESHKLRIVE